MSAQWQLSSNDSLERVLSILTALWHAMARPERARRLRQLVFALLLVWGVLALAQLIWAFLPRPQSELPAQSTILNPIDSLSFAATVEPIDLETMRSWHLFGEACQEPRSNVYSAVQRGLLSSSFVCFLISGDKQVDPI